MIWGMVGKFAAEIKVLFHRQDHHPRRMAPVADGVSRCGQPHVTETAEGTVEMTALFLFFSSMSIGMAS